MYIFQMVYKFTFNTVLNLPLKLLVLKHTYTTSSNIVWIESPSFFTNTVSFLTFRLAECMRTTFHILTWGCK